MTRRPFPWPLLTKALHTSATVLMIALLGASGAHSQSAEPPEELDLPTDAAHAEAALMAELEAIRERLERAELIKARANLQELQLLGEEHPDRLRRRYQLELNAYDSPWDAGAWLALHDRRQNNRAQDEALGAAWHLYTIAESAQERASALLRLADRYADRSRRDTAREVAAIALTLHDSAPVREAWEALEERLRLRIMSINAEAEQALPRVCLRLSRSLAAVQPIPLSDLVEITPAPDALVTVQGEQLCIAGLAHGTQYALTLHKGLTAGDGEVLEKPLQRTVEVPHRQPSVAFSPGAYVLPRTADALIPVRTVNLDEVPLELYRVDDRNLVNQDLRSLLRQPLSRWHRARLENELGSSLWQGTLEVQSVADREVITNLPVEQLLAQEGEGIYVLSAPLADDYSLAATQWLVVSDIGLTTFSASDGLHVFARSLADTLPRAKVELTLVASNNRVLGKVTTDDQGYARFAPGLSAGKGGDGPALLTARDGSDYNFLPLTGAALDLSERGVSGRPAPGPADAFLYTERGIYRPGETVKLSLLLRDPRAMALADLPLTLRVTKPGGLVVLEKVLTSDALGAAHLSIPIANTANAGQWGVTARLDPDGMPVGSTSFQVEDFVPPHIEVEASMSAPRLQAGGGGAVSVAANYYYGAPAADRPVQVQLLIDADPTPFAGYEAFSFGREELEFSPVLQSLPAARTDARGEAELQLPLPAIADRSQPLRVRATAAVDDVGGRAVYETATAAIDTHERYVGLRTLFGAGVSEGEAATFELVALSPEATPVSQAPLRWRFVRERHNYLWYSSGGRWQWRANVIDEPVVSGEGVADSEGRLALERRLPPGRYRLDVFDGGGTASASRRFNVGWWRGAGVANVPDALDLTLRPPADGNSMQRTAFIDAPFAGRALVTLGNERLHRSFEVELPEAGREITFDIDPAWSPGLYLMVTAFRPGAGEPSPLPTRATGLAWVEVGVAQRRLAVTLSPPPETRPRGPVTIPVSVDLPSGIGGRRVAMTVAAVDAGVLALTRFPTPDPAKHYFGQRALGGDVRDVYGDLIAPLDGPLGAVRSGGDSAEDNLGGLAVRSSRLVALYQRDVLLDEQGRGTITLDLPDFNGRLRLMGVAWTDRSLGASDAPLLVRDPVVAELVLPRFLAPGDRADARLDLRNPSDAPMTFGLAIEAAGPVQVELAAGDITLAPGEGQVLPVRLTAQEPGVADLAVEIDLADGNVLKREYALAVRPASPNITARALTPLAPGEVLTVEGDLAADFHPGAHVSWLATNGSSVDVPGLLAELDGYAYRCTEQAISRALPHLQSDAHFNEVTTAIAQVLDRQRYDGRFGLWSLGDGQGLWITAYAYEFLSLAAEQGYDVPSASLRLAERALGGMVNGAAPPYAAAYAAYVLARTGKVAPAVVRRFVLANGNSLPTRIATAHAAAALALIGDREPSDRLFERALRQTRTNISYLEDYGSDRRDAAAMLTLMARHTDLGARGAALSEALERALTASDPLHMSTQELTWLLLAAEQLQATAGELSLRVDGQERGVPEGRLGLASGKKPVETPKEIENLGDTQVRLIRRVRGAPITSPAPQSDGYAIQRRWYDADSGEPVTAQTVVRGQRLVAVIEGESTRAANKQQLLVVDLLPAGFEIENGALGGTWAQLPLAIGPLSDVEYANARDDRYVAALTVNGPARFRLAYLVRATTEGEFAMPGVQVEDMYAPRFRAIGPAARTTITAAQ
ncbi:MAG: MG2 domain-containing protein [Pseudomonadota bacterium]